MLYLVIYLAEDGPVVRIFNAPELAEFLNPPENPPPPLQSPCPITQFVTREEALVEGHGVRSDELRIQGWPVGAGLILEVGDFKVIVPKPKTVSWSVD